MLLEFPGCGTGRRNRGTFQQTPRVEEIELRVQETKVARLLGEEKAAYKEYSRDLWRNLFEYLVEY